MRTKLILFLLPLFLLFFISVHKTFADSPQINQLPDANIYIGDTYTATGSFTDSDSSSWTGTVDYGEGTGFDTLNISGTDFSLSHNYARGGVYPVAVRITDDQNLTTLSISYVYVDSPEIITPLSPQNSHLSGTFTLNTNGHLIETITMNPADVNEIKNLNMDGIISGEGCGQSDHYYIGYIVGDNVGQLTFIDGEGYISSINDRKILGGENVTDDSFSLLAGTHTFDLGLSSNLGGDRFQMILNVYNADESCGFDYIFTPIFMLSQVPYTYTNASVNNAPVINALSGASLVQADTYTESGSFSDADSSSWTGTVDYGDGSGSQSLNISGTNFSLSHQYLATGTYTVTVNLTDDHSNTASTTTSVIVAPRVVTLSPIADTWLKKDYPNQNEGRSIFMRLKETGKNRSLIKFDQSQIAAVIGSSTNYTAKLKVTIVDNSNNWSAAGRPVNVHRLTTDWMEGNGYINGNTPSDAGTGNGATWNCGVDSNIHNTATDCTTAWDMTNNGPFVSTATDTKTIANNQTGVLEFDVTADVQAFMNGTADDGWVIKKADETASGQVQFGTKESASPAQLVITVN